MIFNSLKTKNQNGYTLIEVIISIAVSVLVIGALTFATISSLRNAHLAKRQTQATKYAQEGLERVRSIRGRNQTIVTNFGANFSNLWDIYMSQQTGSCPGNICYFYFTESGILTQGIGSSFETLENGVFRRQIQITDKETCGEGETLTETNQCYTKEKQVTSVVKWTDFAGEHESKLETVLRRL